MIAAKKTAPDANLLEGMIDFGFARTSDAERDLTVGAAAPALRTSAPSLGMSYTPKGPTA